MITTASTLDLLTKMRLHCPLPKKRNQKGVENCNRFSNFKNKKECAGVNSVKVKDWRS